VPSANAGPGNTPLLAKKATNNVTKPVLDKAKSATTERDLDTLVVAAAESTRTRSNTCTPLALLSMVTSIVVVLELVPAAP